MKYSQMERSLAQMMDRLAMDALYGTATTTQSQEQEPFTLAKLEKLIDGLPPAPPAVKFVRDDIFPQEHYADKVAIIPHHPAHTFFAKLLAPQAPTATVIKAGEMNRPDGTCYQIDGTVYVPSSLAHKLPAPR